MESISRKATALLTALGATVLLGQSAWATASATATGTWRDLGGTVESVRAADGITFIQLTIRSEMGGDVVGARVVNAAIVLRADGSYRADGTGTCVCTLAGRSGTWSERFTASGVFNEYVMVHVTVVSGSGGLSGLHAVGTASGQLDPATGFNVGTYSIDYHFDP